MILTYLKEKLRDIAGNDKRTANVIKNTMVSAVMKVASLACSLVMVPITINYLNTENYGIWMAMTSILYWFAFFDVGLGNGMRNYLAEALSLGDYSKARSYFSTAMFILSGIAILIGCIAIPVIYVCNLNDLFNTHNIDGHFLANVLVIAVVFSLIQFVVKNVGMVYIAMQKYAINDFITFLGSIASVIAVFILTKTTEANLMYVVIAFTGFPVLMFTLAAIPLLKQYPQLTPSVKSIDIDTAKKIVTKGLGFFIIQITSCLVIFGSANVFISHYCGPEQVTVYNVAYKLFNVLIIMFTILISPLWNAYTDAAVKGDFVWIGHCFKKSLLLWGLVTFVGICVLLISPYFFQWWVGDSVHIPIKVSIAVLLYVCAFNFANCNAYLINGMNILRVHIITALIMSVIYLIAIAIYGNELGLVGIVLCMALAYMISGCVYLYQCKLIINRRNTGIWSK